MIDNGILRSGECECEKVFPYLSAYIDGELDEKTVACVEEHLEKCEQCRKLLKALSDLSEDIVAASIPYPDDLHSRLMGALNEEMAKGRKKSRLLDLGKTMKKHGMWIGAGVAAVICLVLVGSPVFRESLEFGMNDAKGIAMEDVIMPQNGGIEAACEMSRSNDGDVIYYTASGAETLAGETKTFSVSLSDNVELPMDETDDMTATEDVFEAETKEEKNDHSPKEYSFIPVFMLPRGELGWAKTELTH